MGRKRGRKEGKKDRRMGNRKVINVPNHRFQTHGGIQAQLNKVT